MILAKYMLNKTYYIKNHTAINSTIYLAISIVLCQLFPDNSLIEDPGWSLNIIIYRNNEIKDYKNDDTF